MKKITISTLAIFSLFIAKKAFAICPICSIAVGAGIVFTRQLGMDDSITGLWIGALTISMTMWTINWFKKKGWNFRFRATITTIAYILIVIVPLYYMNMFGHGLNRLWGIDKLLLSIVIGAVGFTIMGLWYEKIKEKNGGHALFTFQKVVMPIGLLTILSFIFYFITQ